MKLDLMEKILLGILGLVGISFSSFLLATTYIVLVNGCLKCG